MFGKMGLLTAISLGVALLFLTIPEMSDAKSFDTRIHRGANGGTDCAACTMIVGITEQLGQVYNESITKSLERLCSYLPEQFIQPCKQFADFIGPFLIDIITEYETPDTICHALGFCYTDPGKQQCRIFPPPKKTDFDTGVRKRKEIAEKYLSLVKRPLDPKICNLPGIKKICAWLDSIFSNHDPAIDLDKDGFSTFETLRGTSWRGKDCDDDDKDKHPGTRPVDLDVIHDSNCNGIYGTEPKSGKPYEEVYCGGTAPQGVAVLGDSVSAHFHIPEEWLEATNLSVNVFKHLPFILENELDWPEMSSFTGYSNNSWSEVLQGPMDSVYYRMWERNRCNFRDYENIAANGARSSSMADKIMKSLSRHPLKDYPMIIFYALVGNDVCNGHPDTFAHMTTPQEMHDNAMKTMLYLDKVLPNNSHVMMSGLVDGRILYDSLHNRIHPLGRLNNDITYKGLYDYLNCLEVSPCTGWLNSNETIRNMTTQRAVELSNVLKNIAAVSGSSFVNFKLYYSDCPTQEVIEMWKKKGGEIWQIIEPVDGFHSNQLGQALTAEVTWKNLLSQFPQIVGDVNPNNAKIKAIFGDQGGYN